MDVNYITEIRNYECSKVQSYRLRKFGNLVENEVGNGIFGTNNAKESDTHNSNNLYKKLRNFSNPLPLNFKKTIHIYILLNCFNCISNFREQLVYNFGKHIYRFTKSFFFLKEVI